MAGVGKACSHVAALLFVLEGNTLLKQQFSCTSLPCSWLPASFHSVSFAEMSKIDFTTPKKKKSAVSIPTDDELQTYNQYCYHSFQVLMKHTFIFLLVVCLNHLQICIIQME